MKVESTALYRLVYDSAAEELTVVFTDRSSYCYCGVPEDVYRLLLSAPSKGRFFNIEIRNRYPCSNARPERSALLS